MDSKNKFWRGVMVGVLVTALVCLITVGASAGIYMFGRRVIDNQTQVQVQTEGTPSQAQEPVNFENVTKKLEQKYFVPIWLKFPVFLRFFVRN